MQTPQKTAVIETLRQHWPELHALGVEHLDLVGSVATDTAAADSDVDLVADFSGTLDFIQFFDLVDRLEAILHCPVDLMSRRALRPHWRDKFATAAVRVA